MTDKKEIKILQDENDKLREDIYKLINEYMMSDERDDIMHKINLLVENEIQQEKLCNN